MSGAGANGIPLQIVCQLEDTMLMEDTGLESAKRLKSVKPARVLVLGFLLVLILGTIALKLPISSVDGESISWVDAFFTSTSAVCVTGLVVVNTAAQWSIFGQCVILALIQIGGLGFMAFTTLIFMIMGRRITLKERLVIQEALNQSTLSGIVKLTVGLSLSALAPVAWM